MTDPVVVVGSGASGMHFAQSALEAGRRVTMLDVGRSRPEPVLPDADFGALKSTLDDPIRHFLGEDYGSLICRGHSGEYYGFPPSKRYVFEGSDSYPHKSSGFAPLLSFASGGLAEAWTGGCYPFTDAELADFPFGSSRSHPTTSKWRDASGSPASRTTSPRSSPCTAGCSRRSSSTSTRMRC